MHMLHTRRGDEKMNERQKQNVSKQKYFFLKRNRKFQHRNRMFEEKTELVRKDCTLKDRLAETKINGGTNSILPVFT